MNYRRTVGDRFDVTLSGTRERPIVVVADRFGPTLKVPLYCAVDVARGLSCAIDAAVTHFVEEEVSRGRK